MLHLLHFRYLRDMKNVSNFGDYMEKMHNARPSLSFHVECYHYETNYESFEEKVVTHREGEHFQFSQCRDLAPPNMNLEGRKATRVGTRYNENYG